MTYADRKEQQRCTYPACPLPPLDDNCQCKGHRDDHRRRNVLWKLRRRVQLVLAW